jgi:hypothetical protein
MATPKKKIEQITPLMASSVDYESHATQSTRTRQNKAGSIERTNRFSNIDDGLIPFKYDSSTYGSKNSASINVKDAIVLCQKAYYNFAIFRNTIDLMTEFSTNNVYYTGGNKKSRDFFKAFFNKLNIYDLQDKFFREYYRSGNVFIYKFSSKLKKGDIMKINQTYSALDKSFDVSIPSKYIILNPADIRMGGNISFVAGKYYKTCSDYELDRLKNPRTEEDQEVVDALDPEIKKQLKDPKATMIKIPLDTNKVDAIFYKKQDYEPFAVPMGYPVLEDINWKAEMKKMDMAISRTIQQAVLVVTMGTDPDKGGVNQRNLEAMQKLFANESVGRVLIADYTTKAEFVIPQIGNILDPKKYEVVNRDIQLGLNNILLSGDEKFANAQIKIQVFVERLKQARVSFLSDFLSKEIKRISKILGFKNYPTPHFEDIELKDQTVYSRIYTRLIELGVLTPEEGIQAIDSGRLPTSDESKESQEDFLSLRKKGFYEPIMGGPQTQKDLAKLKSKNDQANAPQTQSEPAQESGRPPGTGTPQETKQINPIGASFKFSVEKIKDNILKAQKLNEQVEASLRKKHDKRKLSKNQKEVAFQISEVIISNEAPVDWVKSIEKYISAPVDTNEEKVKEINEIAYSHQIDSYLASILSNSKI